MAAIAPAPKGAHLVGSFNAPDAEAVFATVGPMFGTHLHSIPDGETGERSDWALFQFDVFDATEGLERAIGEPHHPQAVSSFRIKEGVAAQDIHFGPTGYLEAALESYSAFLKGREAGTLPDGLRFQVSIPTPMTPVRMFAAPGNELALEPRYWEAMMRDVLAICEQIPSEDLALQWDTSEVAHQLQHEINGQAPPFWVQGEDRIQSTVDRFVRFSDEIPEGFPVGYHFCYGDPRGVRAIKPPSPARLIEVINALSARISRTISWVHIPITDNSTSEEYFAPLADLKVAPETTVYLGLLSREYGIDEAARKMEMARKYLPEFGVATECGLGRCPDDELPDVLEQYRVLSAPVL